MTLSALLLAAIAIIPADRLAMADRMYNRGEYAAARGEYAALRGEASVAADDLLYRLAECDRALGKKDDARRQYGELLERHPASKHADRARLMRALSGTDAERLSELRTLDSDRVPADLRATALYYLGSSANDLALLERSVKTDPKGKYAVYADFHRASLLVKSGDPADRRKGVDVLLSIAFGGDARFAEEALYLAAVQLYSDKRYDEAGTAFRRHLRTYPDGERAQTVRTMTIWSDYLAGKYADAAAMCGEGQTDDAAYLRAACAFATGDNAGAGRLFREYLDRFPQGKYRSNAELPLARLAFDAAEKKDDRGALVANAKRAYALSGASGDALRLAWACERAEMTSEAEAYYVEIAAKFPKTDDAAEALFRKAMLDARAGKWSAADLALAEALASGKNPKRKAGSLYWRGVAAMQLGHEAEGAKFLSDALAAGISLDESREARLMLADVDFRAGRTDAATAAYSRLVREGACERMNAAKILSVGKLLSGEEAKICAVALTKGASPEWRQAGYALLGKTLEASGSFTAAVEAYRKAMAEKAAVADLASAALALGRLESKAGERDRAEAMLRRAVDLSASDPRARAEAYLALATNAEAKGDVTNARAYATVLTSLFSDATVCAEAQKILDRHPEASK
jgi:TolA-binding protein